MAPGRAGPRGGNAGRRGRRPVFACVRWRGPLKARRFAWGPSESGRAYKGVIGCAKNRTLVWGGILPGKLAGINPGAGRVWQCYQDDAGI